MEGNKQVARGQFHLDKANAKLAGVCSGLADYTNVDPLIVRIAVVLLTLMISPITIPIYIVAAIAAEKKPAYLYSDEDEARLLRRMERKRHAGNASGRMRSELSDMDRRVAEMERYYAGSNARLAAEIDSLR